MSSFIGRNKWILGCGLISFIVEAIFKFRAENLSDLMGAILTLAATLTAIFIGFVSIIVSLGADRVFKRLNLDLIYLEKLMLGTFFYLLVSFEAIISFFINTHLSNVFFWYMNIWISTVVMAFAVTLSLLTGLFEFLHGKWKERRDKEDLKR